jgi:hypothetical protein
MTKADVVAGLSSVAAAATLTIRPAVGVEWAIHNFYHEAEAELYVVEGSDELLFDDASAKGSWSAYFFHLTNDHYFKVKNTNVGAKLISYDGVVTKE